MLSKLASKLSSLLARHPFCWFVILAISLVGIEFSRPLGEVAFGVHEASEVARNLLYALAGALIFNWLLVDLPRRRVEFNAYTANFDQLTILATKMPHFVSQARLFAPSGATLRSRSLVDLASILSHVPETGAPRSHDKTEAPLQALHWTFSEVARLLHSLQRARGQLHSDIVAALDDFPLSDLENLQAHGTFELDPGQPPSKSTPYGSNRRNFLRLFVVRRRAETSSSASVHAYTGLVYEVLVAANGLRVVCDRRYPQRGLGQWVGPVQWRNLVEVDEVDMFVPLKHTAGDPTPAEGR